MYIYEYLISFTFIEKTKLRNKSVKKNRRIGSYVLSCPCKITNSEILEETKEFMQEITGQQKIIIMNYQLIGKQKRGLLSDLKDAMSLYEPMLLAEAYKETLEDEIK